jgi:hypothetical protein
MYTVCCLLALALSGAPEGAFTYPRVEPVLLPGDECAFEVDGEAVARFHFGGPKPFVYPLIGPAGRPVTAMLHPADPHGHRHHQSIWVTHFDVNGQNFWGADGPAAIVKEEALDYSAGETSASWRVRYTWRGPEGGVLMEETRTVTLHALDRQERYLDLDLRFTAVDAPVELGKTPFGFLGVRVTPTMSVRYGDGRVVNSEGQIDEAGCHWQRARWIDYAGPVAPGIENGLALFDHPSNPRHPTYFHVRDDGWVGASFCYDAPYTLEPGTPLELTYRLYAHDGNATQESLEIHWKQFAE